MYNNLLMLYNEIMEWSSRFTGEQIGYPDYPYWSEEAKRLLKQLKTSDGQLIMIVGPRGSGKTTLLHLLNHALFDNAFVITWKGKSD